MRTRLDRAVVAAYAVIAYALTFPTWPGRLRTHLAGDSGDALLNLWIVRWVGHHVDDGWGALWDTTMFHPHERTLAYSESLIPVGIAHRLVALVVRSDVLAFNLLYLGAWTASMVAAYALARRLTGHVGGAFLAGLVYTLAVPRLAHYVHFQLAFGFLVPVVVLLGVRYFESPSLPRGLTLGAATAVLALSSSYYGLMTMTAVVILVPGLLVWRRPAPLGRAIAGLAIAAVTVFVLVAPVAYEYVQLQRDEHFRRQPEPTWFAHPIDFVRVMPTSYLLSEVPPFASRSDPEDGTVEDRLYPGTVALGLGAVGAVVLVAGWRRRDRRALEPQTVALLVVAGLVLGLLALGDRLTWRGLDVPMLYATVRDLPGFEAIRATARFVAFPQLVLGILTAIGFGHLLATRAPRTVALVTVAVAAVIVAESAMRIELVEVPARAAARAVNEELATRPPGVVAELPVGTPGDGAAWAYVETPRLWLSRLDGNDRISGYSGFAPPDFDRLVGPVEEFPGVRAFDRLAELDVRYVVLRTGIPGPLPDHQAELVLDDGVGVYEEATARAIVDALAGDPRIASVERHGDAWLLELVR